MKSIIINNVKFPFDLGCRLLKLKHTECPFKELEGIWDDIQPATFVEIGSLDNIEQRRVGIDCLGLERLVKEVKPELLDKKTVKKNTSWINEKGELESFKFNDTYELYKVKGELLGKNITTTRWSSRNMDDTYYVKCKDTSTNREYFIWVDIRDVYRTNQKNGSVWNFDEKNVNAIQSIAWTIQTNVPKENIEKIYRQGDCILIQPKENYKPLTSPRHLTEDEYRKLLIRES